MTPKTSFAFEIYRAESSTVQAAGEDVMTTLEATLTKLLAAEDGSAAVVASDSHKGSNHKIVEITTTLQDAPLADLLKAFGERQGLTISAAE
ncbi:MAG: hypothetical protein V4625_20225 [Pseudomonadota bacterium]